MRLSSQRRPQVRAKRHVQVHPGFEHVRHLDRELAGPVIEVAALAGVGFGAFQFLSPFFPKHVSFPEPETLNPLLNRRGGGIGGRPAFPPGLVELKVQSSKFKVFPGTQNLKPETRFLWTGPGGWVVVMICLPLMHKINVLGAESSVKLRGSSVKFA
jgi:hypothetical protein